MAALNPNSVTNVPGGFHARAPTEKPIASHSHNPRDQPLDPHSHKPGLQIGKDAIPEYHAQTLPPGSAPEERTFTPNTLLRDDDAVDEESTSTSAIDTLGGATSADVNQGLGKPVQGESSRELRHDGQQKRKKEREGVIGRGWGGEVVEQL